MRKPLLDQINRTQKGAPGSAPAPIGGWNTRDSVAALPETDAVFMDNWFPSGTSVDLRKGSLAWATGFSSRVRSLLSYAAVDGTKKLFGCTNSGVYDATTQGAIGAAVTTLTDGYVQSVNYGTPAGSYLYLCNGTDSMKLYDGSTWTDVDAVSTPAITGVATSSIMNLNLHKRRLWMIEKNSFNAWYLPVDSIGGAATRFSLGTLFPRGGHLVSMGTWTIDGGSGVDDLAVFVSSEGEIAVYQGTDPATSTDWSLVGVYFIGTPLGVRCLHKYGGDLLYLCSQGLYPLSAALKSASIDRTQALSTKIDPTFNEVADSFGSNIGWEARVFPSANMLLVNIPAYVGTAAYQYVMNLTTHAWARFTDWNSACFIVWDNKLFFGSENSIVQAWVGNSDQGANIVGKCRTAYSYLGSSGIKQIKLIRPNLQVTSTFQLKIAIDVDFEDNVDYSVIQGAAGGVALWDVAQWDVAVWGSGPTVDKTWNSVYVNDCYAAAFQIEVSTMLSRIQWNSIDAIFEAGGMM